MTVERRRDIERIHDELEQLFADLWHMRGFAGLRHGFRPHVDCYRTDDPPALTVVLDLAGVDPADVELVVAERTLVVAGERRRPAAPCPVCYDQMELEYGPFQRRIALAEDVDPEGAEASYDRGLLTVVLPLAQRPQVGRVSIRVVMRR